MNCLQKNKLCFILILAIVFTKPYCLFGSPELNISKFLFITPSDSLNSSKELNNDILSLKNSLFTAGISFKEINSEQLASTNLKDYDVLILPCASALKLDSLKLNLICKAVSNGINILFDGSNRITERFHIPFQSTSIKVTRITDRKYSKNTLYWNNPAYVKPIDSTKSPFTILCEDDSTASPLAITGSFGKGKFIYFATLFDPITNKGYSRFPFLTEYLRDIFGVKLIAERIASEMYFDPGVRYADNISIENLVKMWRSQKIKRIYASGWYYDTPYDYAKLINECHKNGILVYCWLETPMISSDFWEKHPEWREKTAYLKDAAIDWRLLMNLANENCRKEVFRETGDFLFKYNWDGVNFAELYFEPSPVGPNLPENFTPMNDNVREEFKKKSGFDPVLLFDTKSSHYWKSNPADWRAFADYRKELCYKLKGYFLDFLSSVKEQKKDFELMLTVIDVSLTPELSDFIGEDTKNTLSLFGKYDITLQIEDPSSCWGLTPDRYFKLGELYRKNVKDDYRLVFDCNVVDSHEKGFGGFPSERPSGEEIRQIVFNMASHKARPAFYAESEIYQGDFKNINTTLARDASIHKTGPAELSINAPFTIFVEKPANAKTVILDNNPWLATDSTEIIVPKGDHKLKFDSIENKTSSIELKYISGELDSARFSENSLEFTYSEEANACYVIVNLKPSAILIDGTIVKSQTLKNSEAEYCIKLPKGTHTVKIKA